MVDGGGGLEINSATEAKTSNSSYTEWIAYFYSMDPKTSSGGQGTRSTVH